MNRPLACGDRSGFLFAHACDRPAAGACTMCGTPICVEHTRMGAQGPTCITCLRGRGDVEADAELDDDGADGPEGRREDDPYFYGGKERAAYYDADDYRAFESTPDEPRGLETDTGAS
jgi:hypothetical protein